MNFNIPGITSITSIPNSGCIENYSNACIFISIADYLTSIGNPLKVSELRKIANFSGSNNQMLDYSVYPEHQEQLYKLLEHLNIALLLIDSSTKNHSIVGLCRNRTLVPILHYKDVHFEFITSIKPLKIGDFSNSYVSKNIFNLYQESNSKPTAQKDPVQLQQKEPMQLQQKEHVQSQQKEPCLLHREIDVTVGKTPLESSWSQMFQFMPICSFC